MACYHPLCAIPAGINPSGKMAYTVVPYNERYFSDPGLGAITIPCGHCIGCRLEYSRQWANRLMLELQYHDSSYFVTLTYNEEHVPRGLYKDDDGNSHVSLTLCKRDIQLFMKRLRKSFSDDKIRFYCAGEYGPSTFRPHYHLIIFGLYLDDLFPWQRSVQGFQYFRSPSLERVWSVCEGSHTVL